jgi:hypothetical protein
MPFVPDQQATTPPATSGSFHPDVDQVIKDQTAKAAAAKPPGHHTSQAISGLALPADPRKPKDVDLEQAGRLLKSGARGFVSSLGAMTGDSPREVEARNKKLGLDEPQPSTGDKAAEVVGGLFAPSPGKFPGEAVSFMAARAADQAAGTTLGQQTGSKAVQMLEKTLARLPGGGALVRSVRNQNERLGQTTDDIVQNLSGGADTSAEGAGKMLKGQLKTAAKRMKEEAASHYDEVEKLIPKDTPIGVKNTLETVRKLTTPLQGAENVSKPLINKEIQALREGLEKDLEANHLQAMPYATLKELRTRIGQMIDWGPFSTDPKNGALKQVYNAITADMNIGASSVSKEAAAAVQKATSAYAKSKEEQAVLKAVISKAGGPEKVFNSLMSGTKEGATTIKQVLGAIDEPSRQILAASALQRMGRATAGAQGAAGTAFSAESFLTNWNRMSPEARQSMFGSLPGDYAKSVSRLAANIEGLKAYSKLMENPSGTAQNVLWGTEVGGALLSVLHGDPKTAAAIAGTAAGTAALSTALTNPETTRWLADQTSRLLMNYAKGQAGENGQ